MDIGRELTNFLGERRNLIDAITREFRAGTPAKEIARAVGPAFSRDQVTQYLAAIALHDAARKAFQEAGLAHAVSVSVTGIEAPREARIVLAADPAETPDFDKLPERMRGALHDYHITLDLPAGEHDEEATTAVIDELLLDTEPIRLVKQKPRT